MQVMTYLVENEQAALVVPAALLVRVRPHFREVQQLLAVQAADEARHVEVFSRRAMLHGGPMGTSSAGGRSSLATLLAEPDFSLASFLLSKATCRASSTPTPSRTATTASRSCTGPWTRDVDNASPVSAYRPTRRPSSRLSTRGTSGEWPASEVEVPVDHTAGDAGEGQLRRRAEARMPTNASSGLRP